MIHGGRWQDVYELQLAVLVLDLRGQAGWTKEGLGCACQGKSGRKLYLDVFVGAQRDTVETNGLQGSVYLGNECAYV